MKKTVTVNGFMYDVPRIGYRIQENNVVTIVGLGASTKMDNQPTNGMVAAFAMDVLTAIFDDIGFGLFDVLDNLPKEDALESSVKLGQISLISASARLAVNMSGKTRAEIAELIGSHQPNISRALNLWHPTTHHTASKIIKAAGVRVTISLGGEQ